MRFPETKIRGTTAVIIKGLRKTRRVKSGRFTREMPKVSKLKHHRGLLSFRTKDVETEDGQKRRVRLSQPRYWAATRRKREKYPQRRFWAIRSLTFTWVESYAAPVFNFMKQWVAYAAGEAVATGELVPVSVDGVSQTNDAAVEWPVSYGDPGTVH